MKIFIAHYHRQPDEITGIEGEGGGLAVVAAEDSETASRLLSDLEKDSWEEPEEIADARYQGNKATILAYDWHWVNDPSKNLL